MPWLRILPAVLLLLVLAAHFYRAGLAFLVPACVGLAALAFVRLRWVPRLLSVALLLAAAEWLRTLWVLVAARLAAGQPYGRMVLILLGVALATLSAARLLNAAAPRRWYEAGKATEDG